MNYSADIQKLPRHFLPNDFSITNWEGLEPYFKNLMKEKSILFLIWNNG